MKRRWLTLSLFLVVLWAARAEAEATRDGRYLVDASRYPFSAIGRINADGEAFCTGVLVGERHVLTAAHCLYDFRSHSWRTPGEIHFVAGYQRGEWLAHAVGKSYRQGAGQRNITDSPDVSFAANDWGILELAEPVGRKTGWLGLKIASTDALRGYARNPIPLFEAGYRRDRPYAVSVGPGCRILGVFGSGGAVAHDCNVIRGGSGSPLVAYTEGRFSVVGINSMRLRSKDRGPVSVAAVVNRVEDAVSVAAKPCELAKGSDADVLAHFIAALTSGSDVKAGGDISVRALESLLLNPPVRASNP